MRDLFRLVREGKLTPEQAQEKAEEDLWGGSGPLEPPTVEATDAIDLESITGKPTSSRRGKTK